MVRERESDNKEEGRDIVISVEKTLKYMNGLEEKHVSKGMVDAWIEFRHVLENLLRKSDEEEVENEVDEGEDDDEMEEVEEEEPVKKKEVVREPVVTPREPPRVSRFMKKEVTDDDLLI